MKAFEVVADLEALALRAADIFIQDATAALSQKNRFTVVLSGGKTPREMFRILGSPSFRDKIPWDKVFVFWGDERMVPSFDPDSNYRMAHEEWLGKVPIPTENIFRVPTERGDAKKVASEYEQILHKFFGTEESIPPFDLVYLGMGADGHTASLFADSNYANESHDPHTLVIAPRVEHLKAFRISLTLSVINSAKHIVFLVAGEDKASVVKKIFEDEQGFPAGLIEPAHGNLLWLLDTEAAKQIKN